MDTQCVNLKLIHPSVSSMQAIIGMLMKKHSVALLVACHSVPLQTSLTP